MGPTKPQGMAGTTGKHGQPARLTSTCQSANREAGVGEGAQIGSQIGATG